MIVIDASALLAYLFRETGHEIVRQHIDDCCMSTVNLSEVLGRFARDGHDVRVVLERIASIGIEFIEFSSEQAEIAAALLPKTKSSGLSLGDRACLALAAFAGISALTADRIWQSLDIEIEMQFIR